MHCAAGTAMGYLYVLTKTNIKDYALSIATIHHFSTPERRMKSIQELIRLIQPVDDDTPTPVPVPSVPDRPGRGRFMVYVWAFEQRGGGRRLFDQQLEHCQDDIAAQDVLVPWVRTAQHTQGQEDVHHRCVYEKRLTQTIICSAKTS